MQVDLIKLYYETKDINYIHQWVEENNAIFYKLAYKMLSRYPTLMYDSPEDLAMESIIIFYDKIAQFDPSRTKISTFIYTFIPNAIINQSKSAWRRDYKARNYALSLDETLSSLSGGDYSEYSSLGDTVADHSLPDVVKEMAIEQMLAWGKTHLTGKKLDVFNMYLAEVPRKDMSKKLGVSVVYIKTLIDQIVDEGADYFLLNSTNNGT